MQYWIETTVYKNTALERKLVYNFRKDTWQVKLTNACLTSDHNVAERIRSTRAMIDPNTKIYVSIDV